MQRNRSLSLPQTLTVIAIRPVRFEISREGAERTRLTVILKTGLVDYQNRFRVRVSQVYPLPAPVLSSSITKLISAHYLGIDPRVTKFLFDCLRESHGAIFA